ncbi:protein FAM83F-like [Alosa pseudoharengus]|uniref:protein FAM83F-like n=1 Tax=Alosa pseudoharengus TaxID=34774 RepID=UPI003F8CB009
MAESQLECMDDGHINDKIPESRPEFLYSEEQRVALELLLKEGDGAFKMQLKTENTKDFLSAREIKWIRETVKEYPTNEEDDENSSATPESKEREGSSSSLRSTYWPQLSDTEIPPLDLGWPTGGFFKGVTRVAVHTHPPKQNSPHIKEVVRKLIQEANKMVAIVMDLLTDLHILQDLLDAASKRGVAVYIVLDIRGAPHFLDMVNRLQVGPLHLKHLRVRTVSGAGFQLSFGTIPGILCSKYMLVDGDKVMFGSYSFSWSSFRMDRNMITVMSGQVVDFFDNDFRELYAISEKMDLYKEFHISRPVALPNRTPSVAKRPPATSRFQVSLGDAKGVTEGEMKVPAHKYYNPKYQLAFPGPTASLQDVPVWRGLSSQGLGGAAEAPEDRQSVQASSERLDKLGPLPSSPTGKPAGNKKKSSLKNFFKRSNSQKDGTGSNPSSPTGGDMPNGKVDSSEDLSPEVSGAFKGKNKKLSKMGTKSQSLMTIDTSDENGSKSRKKSARCAQS